MSDNTPPVTSEAPLPTPAEAAAGNAPLAAAKEPAPVEKKEPAKLEPLKKKYKLKVDKGEEELELDLNNDEEVSRYLQKARASDKRFAEAAEIRKAAMEFIDQLRKNPRQVLADPNIGVDIKKFAQEILSEEVEELAKSPEQKEREKLQKELEDLKKQAKDRDEDAKKSEFARLQAEQERLLEADIGSALDVGGLPKTPRTVKAMAEMMMIALQNGIDLTAKDIAPIIKNNTYSEFKEIVNSLADDQLEDFLGKEVLGRLRKKNVAKAKAIETVSSVKSTGNNVKASKEKEGAGTAKKMTFKQFFGV